MKRLISQMTAWLIACSSIFSADMPIYKSQDSAPAAENVTAMQTDAADGASVTASFQSARLIVESKEAVCAENAVTVTNTMEDLYVLQYASAEDACAAYQQYQQTECIEAVMPDRVYTVCAQDAEEDAVETENWGVQDMGADVYCSWLSSIPKDLPEIKIAVIDTGMTENADYFQNRIADGSAGFCASEDYKTVDGHGHGTQAAGIICQATCENVKILPLKAVSDSGVSSSLELYSAMLYAIEQKADVIVLGVCTQGDDALLAKACAAAAEADIPICVPAGNQGGDTADYAPAMFPECLTITAYGKVMEETEDTWQPAVASFCNMGEAVDFCAPGVDILTVGMNGEHNQRISGTSAAAAFAAAACADVLSYQPQLSAEQVSRYLQFNCRNVGESERSGKGILNLKDFVFAEEIGAVPQFSMKAGTYSAPIELELTAEENAEIYYTLDGSVPREGNRILYTAPLELEQTTYVYAISMKDGQSSGCAGGLYCIGGTDIVDAYTVENGVLTAYQGVRNVVDLEAAFPDGSLKAIGAGAFARNHQIQEVILPPSVREIGEDAFAESSLETLFAWDMDSIGARAFADSAVTDLYFGTVEHIGEEVFCDAAVLDYLEWTAGDALTVIPTRAFYGCEALVALDLQWEKLIEVQEEAFQDASLKGEISLDSLQVLGKRAFAGTLFGKVTLSEAITELPEECFCGMDSLGFLSAKGVTAIRTRALADCGWNSDVGSEDMTRKGMRTDIDFGNLEILEPYALYLTKFAQSLEFDGLETITAGQFDGCDADSFSFPNVKTVCENGISNVCGKIYLPQVETIEKNSIYQAYSIFLGDTLKTIEEDGIRDSYVYAGTDSLAIAYAKQHGLEYCTLPCILPVEPNIFVFQGDLVTLDVERIGGEDAFLRWYQRETDGTQTLLAETQNNTLTFCAEGSSEIVITAVLTDGRQEFSRTEFEVFLWSFEPATFLEDGKTVFVDLCERYRAGEEIASEFSISVTPDESGEYYLLPEGTLYGPYTLIRKRGEEEPFAELAPVYDPEKSDLSDHRFYLEKGTEYIITFFVYKPDLSIRQCCVLLYMDKTPPKNWINKLGMYVAAQQIDRNACFYYPDQPDVLAKCSSITVINDGSETIAPFEWTLTADKDFIWVPQSYYGVVYGIGDYWGCTSISVPMRCYEVKQTLTAGESVTLADEEINWDSVLAFTAPDDGIYGFQCLSKADEEEEYIFSERDDTLVMRIINENGDELQRQTSDGEVLCAVLPLQKGKTYYINLNCDYYVWDAFTFSCKPTNQQHILSYDECNIALCNPHTAEGRITEAAGTVPQYRITMSDGTVLQEGIDYRTVVLESDNQQISVEIVGIGAYLGVLQRTEEYAVVVTENVPVVLEESEKTSYLSFTPQKDDVYIICGVPSVSEIVCNFPSLDMMVYEQDWPVGIADCEFENHVIQYPVLQLSLFAGHSYCIQINHDDCDVFVEISQKQRLAECTVKQNAVSLPYDFSDTDLPVVLYAADGTALQENVDFTVMRGLCTAYGEAVFYFSGIGDYCGMLAFGIPSGNVISEDCFVEGCDWGHEQYFWFTPQETDCYTIQLMYAPSVLDDVFTGKRDMQSILDAGRCSVDFIVTSYGQDAYSLRTEEFWTDTCSVELAAGVSYRISVSSCQQYSEGDYVLTVLHHKRSMFTEAEMIKEKETGEFQMYCIETGRRLEEGEDYRVLYDVNTEDGVLYCLVQGIGDYVGYTSDYWYMDEPFIPPTETEKTPRYVSAALDEVLQISNGTSYYVINVPYEMEVQVEDVCNFITTAVTCNVYGKQAAVSEAFLSAGQILHLYKGTYVFMAEQCARDSFSAMRLHPLRISLHSAEIAVSDVLMGTAMQKPQVRVCMNGRIMQENVDYVVQLPADAETEGVHSLTVEGIGDYFGSRKLLFYTLPENAETVSEWTALRVDAVIAEGGAVCRYRFCAEAAENLLHMSAMQAASAAVYDESGTVMGMVCGLSEQQTALSLTAGEWYTLVARFCADTACGTVSLSINPQNRMFSDCTVSLPATVAQGTDLTNCLQVMDGELLLTYGEDYECTNLPDAELYGRVSLQLCGKGCYEGIQAVQTFILPNASLLQWKSAELLSVNRMYYQPIGDAWNQYLFAFIAPSTGDYILTLPTWETDRVTALLYDAEGNLLPFDTKQMHLQEKDTIYCLCVTDADGSRKGTDCCFALQIAAADNTHFVEADNMVYLVNGKEATLLQVRGNAAAYNVPTELYDARQDCMVQVTACDDVVENDSYFLYIEQGTPAAAYCQARQRNAVYLGAECTVQGDLTGDDVCDWTDVQLMQFVLSETAGIQLCASAAAQADCNEDGILDYVDLQWLLEFSQTE